MKQADQMNTKNKYLPKIPKPLLNDLVNNRVIPFVGAGFSKNADIPQGISMPDWNELGKSAAQELPDFPYDNNAIEALSYYEYLYSRNKLIEFLMRTLHVGQVKPGETYKAFCRLFTGTICTTNFDFLLEDAMKELQQPISTIINEERLAINANGENRLIKLHGDFNHPEQMVITENDYDAYLERNPIIATYISNLFITNTMLLIGYSFDDSDLRGIWQIINSRLGRMNQPAYCIMVNASTATIAKFKRRNVTVINLPGKAENYKTILLGLFDEIQKYKADQMDKAVKSSNEKINEQMLIPAENNRLCYISCSYARIARITPLIYPVLFDLGITPVRLDEIMMPGDNWMDNANTLARKCKYAIVDISDNIPNVLYELGVIKADKEKTVIIIREEGNTAPLPSILLGQLFLTYTLNEQDELGREGFIDQLKRAFQNSQKSDPSNSGVYQDAHRLFEKEEYSSCIVSAFSELTYHLSVHYPVVDLKGSLSLAIKRIAYEKDIPIDSSALSERVRIRNKILYESYHAAKDEAEQILGFVEYMHKKLISS